MDAENRRTETRGQPKSEGLKRVGGTWSAQESGPPADLRPGGQGKGCGKGKSKDHAGYLLSATHTQTGRALVEL